MSSFLTSTAADGWPLQCQHHMSLQPLNILVTGCFCWRPHKGRWQGKQSNLIWTNHSLRSDIMTNPIQSYSITFSLSVSLCLSNQLWQFEMWVKSLQDNANPQEVLTAFTRRWESWHLLIQCRLRSLLGTGCIRQVCLQQRPWEMQQTCLYVSPMFTTLKNHLTFLSTCALDIIFTFELLGARGFNILV